MKRLFAALVLSASLGGCAVYPSGPVYVDPVGAAVVGGAVGLAIGASIRPAPVYGPAYVPYGRHYVPPGTYHRHGGYYRQPRY